MADTVAKVAAYLPDGQKWASYGLALHEFQPYRMAMLVPELVIAVAMTIENYGLEFVPQSRTEPLLDPKSLWRVPSDINLTPR